MTERVEQKIPTVNTTQVKKSIACAPRSNLASSSNSDANRHLTRTSTRLKGLTKIQRSTNPNSPIANGSSGQSNKLDHRTGRHGANSVVSITPSADNTHVTSTAKLQDKPTANLPTNYRRPPDRATFRRKAQLLLLPTPANLSLLPRQTQTRRAICVANTMY